MRWRSCRIETGRRNDLHAPATRTRRTHALGHRLRIALATGIVAAASAVIAAGTASPPLIVVDESCEPSVRTLFERRGATPGIVIYQDSIDPDNDGRFNPQVLQAALDLYVPRRFEGTVCLDWEGNSYMYLTGSSQSAAHVLAVNQFIAAINFARTARPMAKFGFYNLPMSSYTQDQNWYDMANGIKPIIDASDVLFPSVYDMYATGQLYTNPSDDLNYVSGSVKLALDMAHGKPVYPFVWPRYNMTNSTYGMRLIPEAEFKSHVAAVFSPQVNGHRADGVVWWGADRHFRWLSKQNFPITHPLYKLSQQCKAAFAAEILPGETDEQYFTRIHQKTLRQLAEVMAALP
jgi:hypothetical protein